MAHSLSDLNRIESLRRDRLLLVALAFLVVIVVHLVFERQATRLDELAGNGKIFSAMVTSVKGTNERYYINYQYHVGNKEFSWEAKGQNNQPRPGEQLKIMVSQSDPTLSRAVTDAALIKAESAEIRTMSLKIMLGAFAFFMLIALRTHFAILKYMRSDYSWVFDPEASAKTAGFLVFGSLVFAVVASNFNEDVQKQIRPLTGDSILGMPSILVFIGAQLLLLLPFLIVFRSLMRLIFQAREDKEAAAGLKLLIYIWHVHEAHPQLQSDRRNVIWGLRYFVLLAGAWIALAS